MFLMYQNKRSRFWSYLLLDSFRRAFLCYSCRPLWSKSTRESKGARRILPHRYRTVNISLKRRNRIWSKLRRSDFWRWSIQSMSTLTTPFFQIKLILHDIIVIRSPHFLSKRAPAATEPLETIREIWSSTTEVVPREIELFSHLNPPKATIQ